MYYKIFCVCVSGVKSRDYTFLNSIEQHIYHKDNLNNGLYKWNTTYQFEDHHMQLVRKITKHEVK